MNPLMLIMVIGLIALSSSFLGYRRVFWLSSLESIDVKDFHSRPGYYGLFVALCSFLPAILLIGIWIGVEPFVVSRLLSHKISQILPNISSHDHPLWISKIKVLAQGKGELLPSDSSLNMLFEYYSNLKHTSHFLLSCSAILLSVACSYGSIRKIASSFKARQHAETVILLLLGSSSLIAIFITISIVSSVLFESLKFFEVVSPLKFLFGTHWSPQIAMRSDQMGSSASFGAVPVFLGTFLISFIAMAVALPVGLLSAIYTSEYASERTRKIIKPFMEILAGIPTVVYGFFAALTVGPVVRTLGEKLGLDVSSESALAAGLVMGLMIIPFISSISDDAMSVVPQSLREGAYALGSTKSEMIKKVLLPAALPGVAGGVLLAVSRAIGETMIVVMAAGLSANLTLNPFKDVTTVTVQMVTLLTGDQEFDNPKTLAAFALGLTLFVSTLLLNTLAIVIVRKYREQYE